LLFLSVACRHPFKAFEPGGS